MKSQQVKITNIYNLIGTYSQEKLKKQTYTNYNQMRTKKYSF
jgi:hypothetical protein